MKFNAALKPIENPKESAKDDMTTWMSEVNRKVFNRKPLNAPNVVSQSTFAEYIFVSQQIANPTPPIIQTGIWGGGVNFGVTFLQSPTRYKLNKINDVNLNINTSFTQSVGFSGAPTPSGSYTMYYYVVLSARPTGLNTTQDWYLVIPFEFNYNNTTQSFSFTQSNINLQLSDTIKTRQIIPVFGTGYPNFQVDSTKITEDQYRKLISEDLVFNITAGFDSAQLGTGISNNPVLSASNKAHFEYFLYANGTYTPTTPFTYFNFSTSLVFTYSGLFADYKPLDN